MADARFYSPAEPLSLNEIAEHTGSSRGDGVDGGLIIEDVAPLALAARGHISFLADRSHLDAFRASRAGACFVQAELAEDAPDGMALLINEAPQLAYAVIAAEFHPTAPATGEVSEAAQIDPSAEIGDGTSIRPGAVIEGDVRLGRGCEIGANTVIGRGVQIGDGCRIGAGVTITHSILGDHVIVHAGARLGQDGFGYVPGPASHQKIPQLGRVLVGDHVEIGANTTIDRGAAEDTVIGDGSKIDNLVQIGHNCRIGRCCIIVSQVGLSGSVTLDDYAVLGGQVGIADHVRIGAGAQVAAKSGVMRPIPPRSTFAGIPAKPVRDWHRETIVLNKLAKTAGKRREPTRS